MLFSGYDFLESREFISPYDFVDKTWWWGASRSEADSEWSIARSHGSLLYGGLDSTIQGRVE